MNRPSGGLLARMRRRKWFQWGLAYLAAGWLVLQVLDFFRENFGWSPFAVQVITVLVGVGFLVTLLLAWYHGEQGRQRVSPVELALLVGLLTAGSIAIGFLPRDSEAGGPLGRAAAASPTGSSGGAESAEVSGDLARGSNPSFTIAVLPFENTSTSEEDYLLADGFQSEIGSHLSTIADLRVISRSSVSTALAGGTARSAIGDVLGAGYLLDGVVQVSEDRIRVTAELSEAGSGVLRWSKTFDGGDEFLFDLQAEVALAVADALDATLTETERARVEGHGSVDLAAYRLFQRQRRYSANHPSDNRLGIELLKESLALDPTYGEAMARLAWRYVWEVRGGRPEALDSARMLAGRAVELEPDLALARYALASVHTAEERFGAAARAFRTALLLDPSNESVLMDLSFFLAQTGNLEEALDIAVRSVRVAPNNASARWHVAVPLLLLGELERTADWVALSLSTLPTADGEQARSEGIALDLEVLEGRPGAARERALAFQRANSGRPEPELEAAWALSAIGEWQAARNILERHAAQMPGRALGFDGVTRTVRTALGVALWRTGERGRAAELFAEAESISRRSIESDSDWSWAHLELASIHAVRGDRDAAFVSLDRAYSAGFRAWHYLRVDPAFEELRDDADYIDLLERMRGDVARMARNAERDGLFAPVDSIIAEGR